MTRKEFYRALGSLILGISLGLLVIKLLVLASSMKAQLPFDLIAFAPTPLAAGLTAGNAPGFDRPRALAKMEKRLSGPGNSSAAEICPTCQLRPPPAAEYALASRSLARSTGLMGERMPCPRVGKRKQLEPALRPLARRRAPVHRAAKKEVKAALGRGRSAGETS